MIKMVSSSGRHNNSYCVYEPNNRQSNCVSQKLTELQENKDESRVGTPNTHLLEMDSSSRQELSGTTAELNSTSQLDIKDVIDYCVQQVTHSSQAHAEPSAR